MLLMTMKLRGNHLRQDKEWSFVEELLQFSTGVTFLRKSAELCIEYLEKRKTPAEMILLEFQQFYCLSKALNFIS